MGARFFGAVGETKCGNFKGTFTYVEGRILKYFARYACKNAYVAIDTPLTSKCGFVL